MTVLLYNLEVLTLFLSSSKTNTSFCICDGTTDRMHLPIYRTESFVVRSDSLVLGQAELLCACSHTGSEGGVECSTGCSVSV